MLRKIEKWLPIAERIVTLIRPKFYNRLTWVIVIAGLVQLATPWWSELVSALVVRYFELRSLPNNSSPGWGVLLIGLALLYHLIAHYVSELLIVERTNIQLATHKAHDIEVFRGLATLIPEQDLSSLLSDLNDQHAYRSSQGRMLDSATRYLSAPSTQFLTEGLVTGALDLNQALRDMRNWTSLNFFPYGIPSDDYRYCLYPDLNPDRSSSFPTPEESKRYDRFVTTLNEKTDAVEAKYLDFRQMVKKSLAI